MKYPRTYHVSGSQEVFSDDKMLSTEVEESFLNKDLIVTEKLDGGNACLFEGKVFARTHATETFHPSFSKLKALYHSIYYSIYFDFDRYMLFGENMQALHSIEYTKLNSAFYLFGVFDNQEKIWLSWKELKMISEKLSIPTVPFIVKISFKTIKEWREWIDMEMKKESALGPNREGFVFRVPENFNEKDFSNKVCKAVRKGHVQTEEHWSKNWVEQKIINI